MLLVRKRLQLANATAFLMVMLGVGSTVVQAAQKVNVMLFYEKPESVASFDRAIDYIKKIPSFNIEIGKLYKVMSNGSDATRLIQSLCKDIDGAYGQPEGERPDIIVDFTLRGIPSEAVKLLTKVMTLPTISGTLGQEGDIRSWRDLTEKQKSYLIQIAPPVDMLLQAVRSLVAQQDMTSAGILVEKDYETYHKSKRLLNGMPTKHLFDTIWGGGGPNDTGRFEINHFVDLDIINFFIAASLKNISNTLGTSTRTWSKENSYFSDEYAWYSMSMETGLPNCGRCKDNVSLIHLEPKLSKAGATRRAYLKSKKLQENLMSWFYFDLTMNAISTVAMMKKAGTWVAPPKRVCKEQETVPDDYELALFDNLASPEISKENALGPFHFDPEKAVGKSFSKFQMTIRRLQYNPGEEIPSRNVELGTWETGFLEKELIISRDMENEWEDHLSQGVIRIATVLQKPFAFKSPKCGMTREYRIKKIGSNDCPITGSCINLLDKITRVYNLTYSTRTLSRARYTDFVPRQWEQLYFELRHRGADVNLGEVPIKLNGTDIADYVGPLWYEFVGISIPVPKGTEKASLLQFLAKYATDRMRDEVSKCILNRLRYFSFKSTV